MVAAHHILLSYITQSKSLQNGQYEAHKEVVVVNSHLSIDEVGGRSHPLSKPLMTFHYGTAIVL